VAGGLVLVVVGAFVEAVGALVVVVVVGTLVVVVVVGALVVVVGAFVVVVVVGALVVVVGDAPGIEEAAITPYTGTYPFSIFTMLTPRSIQKLPPIPKPDPQLLIAIQKSRPEESVPHPTRYTE